MKNAFGKISSVIVALCIATTINSHAQTFSQLVEFNGTNGAWPLYGALVQGTDGNFWGTTDAGGSNFTTNGGQGTVFKITPAGKLTSVYSFCPVLQGCTTGVVPYFGLLEDGAGNFFGTTYEGGSTGLGTLFELTPHGELTTIHSFCSEPNCADGRQPSSGLTEATDGNFYGSSGGGYAVYAVTPSGGFTFKTFGANGGLGQFIEASDGHFWGIGGPGEHREGAIAMITSAGEYKTLYNFCSEPNCADGSEGAWLMQGADGNFYGDTLYGGAYNAGVIFKFTPSGQYSVLYNFCARANCADGATPYGGLIQGTDGNFYGTTTFGGVNIITGQLFQGYGTVFQLTPDGVLTTLHTFCEKGGFCADGAYPLAALVQGTDGDFYGTASGLGPSLDYCPGNPASPGSCGSVFKVSMGLAPFVEANPSFGKAGAAVNILGNNLAQSSSVTFNGVSASFKVVSSTFIKAQVPTTATSGMIEVTTPSGTVNSNVTFQVLP